MSVLILINLAASNQVYDVALQYAEKYFDAGYYDEAITEYDRYVYFNPQGEHVSHAYSRMGIAYRNNRQWEHAVTAFRNALYTAPNDSIRFEREIALAITCIASGNYSAGEMLLLKTGFYADSPDVKQKTAFLRGVACVYGRKWQSARGAFNEYFADNPDSVLQTQIDTLLKQAEQFYYKSPDDARGLSTFIPGLGQLYAGDWRNGLNAFLLNGGLEAVIIYKLWNGYIGDAYIIYSFLFRRYYTGNRYHAERIAREYNENLDQNQVDRIINALLEE